MDVNAHKSPRQTVTGVELITVVVAPLLLAGIFNMTDKTSAPKDARSLPAVEKADSLKADTANVIMSQPKANP